MFSRSASRRASLAPSPLVLAVVVMAWICVAASTASAQAAPTGRFVLGPLTWTPTLQLRDAGLDTNIFNTATDVKQDVTATVTPSVDSMLTLGLGQLVTSGALDYVYFQKYTNQRSLNRRVASRILFPLTRIQPAAGVTYSHAKDRTSDEIDVRAVHTDHAFDGSLTTKLSQRIGLVADVNKGYVVYDSGQAFRGADLAQQLNRQSTNISTGLRFTATPLTSFYLDAGVGRDGFTLDSSRNTNNIRGDLGFDFAPDAVFAGHAQVGYHKMLPQHDNAAPGGAIPFSGVTALVDMSYTLLGRTRFNPRYLRDSTYSASALQPYHLSTTMGLDILQTLYGPMSITVRGSRDTMVYPATELAAGRTDRADVLGGGFFFRITTSGTASINYEDSKRRSDAGSQFGYARRRIYTTITYGF